MMLRGMSGASTGACLGHHLGHVFGMSGDHLKACLGQSKISAVLHASLMPFLWKNEGAVRVYKCLQCVSTD